MCTSRGPASGEHSRVRPLLAVAARCTVFLVLAAGQAHTSRAAVDPNIWATNGPVSDIVPDGGTLFVGGSFTRIGPATGSGVPVSTATFAPVAGFPRVIGNVTAVVADGAGGWYIGGEFTAVGGVPRQNLAHITDALTVDDWAPTVDALIQAMVVTPTDVILGGTFTTVNGLSLPRLARIARATGLVSSWTPAPNDQVSALATDGATLYVAGWFGSIAGTGRAGLAAFTLATDALTSWNPAATSLSPTVQMQGVALANGYVYVCGNFNQVGGQSRQFTAALQPGSGLATAWHPPGANGAVSRLLPIGDRVILGGSFSSPGWGIAAVDTAVGTLIPWSPRLDLPFGSVVQVRALEAIGSRVAVGGSFSTNNPGMTLTGNFAVFDTASAAKLPAPKPTSQVWALARQGSQLYIGGQFTQLDAGVCRNLVAVDAVTGQSTGWAPEGLLDVTALAVDSDRAYVVVSFTDFGGVARTQVRAYSRANAQLDWLVDSDAHVRALALNADVLYCGGQFNFLGDASQNLKALEAATGLPMSWAPAPNNQVRSLLAAPGGLVVGGDFTTLGGQPRSRLGQVDYVSAAATAWNPGADNAVSALARSGSTLYAGGDFANAGGQPRSRVAALDLGSNAALPWNPGADASVVALATDGTNVYAGGTFTSFAGQSAPYFAAVNGATGTPLSWGAHVDGLVVSALALANSRVYLGGWFLAVDDEPVSHLAGVFDPALLAVEPPPAKPSTWLAVGPSPMRGTGRVRFTLDHAAPVWLRVIDVSGRTARTLLAGEVLPAGPHTVPLEPTGLAPGVYHVLLRAGPTPGSTRFVVVP